MKTISTSVSATLKIGRAIAANLAAGDILLVSGQLGSGKTVLVKGMAEGLGVPRDKIVSPTFTLIREYPGELPLYHFDLYRLSREQDILALGPEEYFYGSGVCAIEWPERLGSLLPPEHLAIRLSVLDTRARGITFHASGRRYTVLMEKVHADIGH